MELISSLKTQLLKTLPTLRGEFLPLQQPAVMEHHLPLNFASNNTRHISMCVPAILNILGNTAVAGECNDLAIWPLTGNAHIVVLHHWSERDPPAILVAFMLVRWPRYMAISFFSGGLWTWWRGQHP